MAHEPRDMPFWFLGFAIWGDLGGLTIYRDRYNRLVAFSKTTPTGPPTASQLMYRQIFKDASQAYARLPPQQKANWQRAAQKLSLCATGLNLFVHYGCTGDYRAIQTIERQTGLTLLHGDYPLTIRVKFRGAYWVPPAGEYWIVDTVLPMYQQNATRDPSFYATDLFNYPIPGGTKCRRNPARIWGTIDLEDKLFDWHFSYTYSDPYFLHHCESPVIHTSYIVGNPSDKTVFAYTTCEKDCHATVTLTL